MSVDEKLEEVVSQCAVRLPSGMRMVHVLASYEEEKMVSQWMFLCDCLRAGVWSMY